LGQGTKLPQLLMGQLFGLPTPVFLCDGHLLS